jgi:hypothetical protein
LIKKFIYILAFLAVPFLAFEVDAATYYVDQSGNGSADGTSYANRAAIATYNAGTGVFGTLDGDTVYFCGTITTGVTVPDGGASSNEHTVHLDCSTQGGTDAALTGAVGLTISSKDYVIVQGGGTGNGAIRDGSTRLLLMNDSDNITIDGVDFLYTTQSNPSFTLIDIGPTTGGSNLVIKNCLFDDRVEDDDQNDFIEIASYTGVLIYNNTFEEVTHDPLFIQVNADYVVIKDNTFSNSWQYNFAVYGWVNVLIDGNTSNDAASLTNPYTSTTYGVGGRMYGEGPSDIKIVRFNVFYNNDTNFNFQADNAQHENNYFYHNTLYGATGTRNQTGASGYAARWSVTDAAGEFSGNTIINNIFSEIDSDPPGDNVIWYNNTASVAIDPTGNVIEKNIFYDDSYTLLRWGDVSTCVDKNVSDMDSGCTSDGWANNLQEDPLMTDPGNQDFTLQSGSGAINAAREITTVNDGDGSGSTMTVTDAGGLYTTGSPWNTPGGIMSDDKIYIDNAGTDYTTTITAIDYGTDTLTLADSVSFDNGAKIYVCPDGTCFSDSAPDIGAYEASYSNPIRGVTVD